MPREDRRMDDTYDGPVALDRGNRRLFELGIGSRDMRRDEEVLPEGDVARSSLITGCGLAEISSLCLRPARAPLTPLPRPSLPFSTLFVLLRIQHLTVAANVTTPWQIINSLLTAHIISARFPVVKRIHCFDRTRESGPMGERKHR
jgi:hypothetical protein